MAIHADQIIDLLNGTLKHLGRNKFQQIAQSVQRYEVLSKILKKDGMQFDSGTGIQRNVMVKDSGSAKMVRLYEEDELNVIDVMRTISVPWRHMTYDYGWERRELLMNRGASRIVDLLKTRRVAAQLSAFNLMEEKFWQKPEDSTDEMNPFGVDYWVTSSQNTTPGFLGGAPTGFSEGAGGLIHDHWKNWTGGYGAVTVADLFKKMREASVRTNFESPMTVSEYRKGAGQTNRIYTNYSVYSSMEEQGQSQNDNLGADLAPYDGRMVFKRNPITWIPQLDSRTDDPVYMLNFSYFYPVFLRGDYLQESEAMKMPNSHNTYGVFVDLTFNYLCVDRRRQAVFVKAAA